MTVGEEGSFVLERLRVWQAITDLQGLTESRHVALGDNWKLPNDLTYGAEGPIPGSALINRPSANFSADYSVIANEAFCILITKPADVHAMYVT